MQKNNTLSLSLSQMVNCSRDPELCTAVVRNITLSLSLSQMVNCSRDPELCTAVVCNISDFSSTPISILVLSYVDNRFFRVSFKIFFTILPFSLPNFIFSENIFAFDTSHFPFFHFSLLSLIFPCRPKLETSNFTCMRISTSRVLLLMVHHQVGRR